MADLVRVKQGPPRTPPHPPRVPLVRVERPYTGTDTGEGETPTEFRCSPRTE